MAYLDNFHHQILGQGNPIKMVFLHGLMGSGINWRKITTQFEDRCEILIYDQRGHGRSFQPEGKKYAPEDYADDLLKILDELGWEEILLIGHSMGGRNAINFAHRFPQRVKALVIEDIGPMATDENRDHIQFLLSQVPVPFASKLEARDFFKEEFIKRISPNPNAETLSQYFYMNIEEKPNGQADWRFSYEGIINSLDQAREGDRWQEVDNLSMPCLLVRGERSNELTDEVFQEMLRRNSRLEGQLVEDSGHWVHSEQPKAFKELLEAFFNNHQFV